MTYQIVSLAQRYELYKQQIEICDEAWPVFMCQDDVSDIYWSQFIEAFKDCQLLLLEGEEILAILTTVPLFFEQDIQLLPDEGWDWGIQKSVEDYKAGIKPNVLMGVQIVINKSHQGKGLSSLAVKEMATLARQKGFQELIIPVRPSNKSNYPLIEMDDYVSWTNDNGLPFDNWLRVHVRAGGNIIKVCPKAMYISGTIEEWRSWTNMDFPGTGSYIVEGALNPVEISLEQDRGVYVEPNVWIVHQV